MSTESKTVTLRKHNSTSYISARRRFVTFTVSFLYAYLIAFYYRQYKNNYFLTFARVRVVDVGDQDLWTTKGFNMQTKKKNVKEN